MSERIEVKGLLPSELEAVMVENGLERFRGRQVAQWMYGRGRAREDHGCDLPRGDVRGASARDV
ncbi:hypothetical protein MK139_11070, partial [bacterium]|nr:hypothetical protein [bacterium]